MCGLFGGICGSALVGETIINVMHGAKVSGSYMQEPC
jgi:MFS superfamily sulfate permease-like transporter